MATVARTPLTAMPRGRGRTEIRVLDNPLASHDAALARAVDATLRDVLEGENLGVVEVRFRVCRELSEGIRFICKVENPPMAEISQGQRLPVRWWSPLMETAQDFRAALQEALEARRERARALELAVRF